MVLHSPTSTSLKRPREQRAVWGSSDPGQFSSSRQAAESTEVWTRLCEKQRLRETPPSAVSLTPHVFLCTAYCWLGNKAKHVHNVSQASAVILEDPQRKLGQFPYEMRIS